MKRDELNKILEEHKRWSKNEGGKRADLSYADLRYADLSYADLSSADLSGADLSSADLSYADLSSADLNYADLSYADLSSADLSYADLSSADLSYADLSSADLSYADLSSADLNYADLSYADLSSADLSGADLRYAITNRIKGQKVVSVQVDTSRKNNPINYWIDLDVATTGGFQGTLDKLKEAVEETHKNNDVLRKRYQRVIKFIEETVEDYKENDKR